jgi:hypothetical protein
MNLKIIILLIIVAGGSIVFSWTLEDLLNENLFKYQVLSSLFNNLTYEKYIELLRNYLAEL